MYAPVLAFVLANPSLMAAPTESEREPLTLWVSSDQLGWKVRDATGLPSEGSQPEAVLLSKATPSRTGPDAGTLMLYLRDDNQWVCVRSVDQGRTWTGKSSVTINGLPAEFKDAKLGAPSVVQLDDGRVRAYFVGQSPESNPENPFVRPPRELKPLGPAVPDLPKTPSVPRKPVLRQSEADSAVAVAARIYSAISNDGVTFAVEDGIRFELADARDPEVVMLPPPAAGDPDTRRIGPWLMFLNRGQGLLLAHSKDGLSWARDESFAWDRIQWATGCVSKGGTSERVVRLFAGREQAVVSGLYDPSTGSLVEDSGSRLPDKGQDAAVVPAGDGTFLLIRRQEAADKKSVPGQGPPTLPGRPSRPPATPKPPPS